MKIYLIQIETAAGTYHITIEAPAAGIAIVGAMLTLSNSQKEGLGLENLIECEEIKINSLLNHLN